MGYKGKSFTFLKFRSMYIDGNEQIHKDYVKKLINGQNQEINMGSSDKPTYKIANDPRITRIGRILRKTSLDEVPQLINVLFGQMSLVGPRPPIPYEVEMYKGWHLQRILEVKPGVTGLWQIEGRSSTTFDEMVRMDLQYVRKKSIRTDLKIILKTFTVVFKTEGAM
jgi:lipopolysaccharide/colanic/teichoic acid biosynthesis glycosyltransferase